MIETILSNFHLEKILWIVKKRLALMLIIGAMCGAAGGAFAMLTNENTYTASVSFFVYSNPDYVSDTSVNMSGQELALAKSLVQSYTLVLKSDTVMNAVIEQLDLPYAPKQLAASINYQMVEDTSVFYITVSNSDPYRAMEIANTLAEVAPQEISRIVKSGGIEVIDYATLPTMPMQSASITTFALLGFVGGFGMTAVAVLFIGLMDTTVRRKYELRLNFDIPIIGEIPLIAAADKKQTVEKVLNDDSPFAVKESYSSLRSNLMFTAKGEKCPVYAITSAEPDEGKTLNSINIAQSLSQVGKRVLLIDADMRNSSVSDEMDLNGGIGLSQFLAGMEDEPNYLKINKNFIVLPAGRIPPNPAELLVSERMKELIEFAKKTFDCVIIDLPPVGLVSDALNVCDQVVGYLLVVRAGESKIVKEKNAIRSLENVGATICGFIFNGINVKSADYAYRRSEYKYHYGEKKKD